MNPENLLCQPLEYPLRLLLLPLKVRAAFKHKTKVWSLTSSSGRTTSTKPFSSDIVSTMLQVFLSPFPGFTKPVPNAFLHPLTILRLNPEPANLDINLAASLLCRQT